MRIRTIKPEFWRSDDIDALCLADRLLFIGLWSYVDDSGIGVDKESSIAADLFAGDLARDFSEASLRTHGGLMRLHAAGLITRYSVDGRRYLKITNFPRHQKINRPTPSRYPSPTCGNAVIHDPLTEDSLSPHGALSEDSLRARKEQGNRGTGEQGNSELSLRSSSGADAPRADDPTKIDPRTVTAAWVDAVRANDVDPSKAQIGQVARAAKELLQTNSPGRVLQAARAAGAKGFVQIDRELTVMNGAPVGGPTRIPTTTARVQALDKFYRDEPGAAS